MWARASTPPSTRERAEAETPEVEDNKTSVLVRIRHERLASPEEIINEYLQTHDEITNITVRQLTGIGSENQVKRIFQKMITAGALESVPGRSLRYSAYRLPDSAASTTPGSFR